MLDAALVYAIGLSNFSLFFAVFNGFCSRLCIVLSVVSNVLLHLMASFALSNGINGCFTTFEHKTISTNTPLYADLF